MNRLAALGVAILSALVASPLAAAATEEDDENFFDLSIEELVDIQVTSVAGVERDWFDTPSAITVLTGEQLRKSGFTTLSDALRMVPGMHVAKVDSRQTAVSARGFSNLFSNTLQVVIDGRVVYNDLFGGVFWDVQELLIEDIDRIEVIRGPGATLWGANAVNGVVNVITRSAKETVGNYLSGGAGNEERGFVEGRHGGTMGEDVAYRVWGRFAERDSSKRRSDNGQRGDDWNIGLAGFQVEGRAGEVDLMLQGQGHSSDKFGQGIPSATGPLVGNSKTDGGHVLVRASRESDPSKGWTVQAYFDIEDRRGLNGFDDRRDTYDIGFRDRRTFLTRHELIWGGRFRHRRQQTRNSALIQMNPQDRDTNLGTAFIQDTITIVPDRIFAMIGSKFEHNDATGFEVQPSGRLWWTPEPRVTIWTAVSRPVRRPSLIEQDITAVIAPGVTLRGSRDLDVETLFATELGGRVRLTPAFWVDVAAFYNYHDDLIVQVDTGGGNRVFRNKGSARGYGFEATAFWQASSRVRIEGSYSFYELEAVSDRNRVLEQRTPRHQFQVRPQLELIEGVSAVAALYYVGEVREFDIDAYFRLDLGLTWRPCEWLEASVFGQNLIEDHAEFFNAARVDTQPEIERGVYGRLKFRF